MGGAEPKRHAEHEPRFRRPDIAVHARSVEFSHRVAALHHTEIAAYLKTPFHRRQG